MTMGKDEESHEMEEIKKDSTSVQVEEPQTQKEFSGLTKEELLKFANDPTWVRLRWGLFIAFWLIWFALLVAAVLLIVFTPKCPPKPEVAPYESGIFYKVEVPKFKDASGDGKGDLLGVLAKLQYIKDVGANILVLSPILKGLGRMVNTLTAIDPSVGTEDDFKSLLTKAHEEGFKVLLEYSPNYACPSLVSSVGITANDLFTNFPDAASNNLISRAGKKAFIQDNKLLNNNNWLYSSYNGEAMPLDLNLANLAVRNKVKETIKHMLYTLNADGVVLLDASYLVECANLTKASALDSTCAMNQGGSVQFVSEIREMINVERKRGSKYERYLAVEVKTDVSAIDAGVSTTLKFAEAGAHLVLLEGLSSVSHQPNLAGALKSLFANVAINDTISLTPTASPGGRVVTTLPWAFGSALHGRPDPINAKPISALSALLPGVGYIYYGDEIDLPGDSASIKFADANFTRYMQWTNDPATFGFTSNASNFKPTSGSASLSESNAMYQNSTGSGETTLKWVHQVAKLRSSEEAFRWGAFHAINVSALGSAYDNVLAFWRVANGYKSTFLVLVNLGAAPVQVANVSELVKQDKKQLDEACVKSNGRELSQSLDKLLFKVALAAVDGDFKEDAEVELTNKAIVLAPRQVLALKLLDATPAK